MAGRRKRKKIKIIPQYSSCPLCGKVIDYKDTYKLKKFITTRGRIIPSIRTGVCHTCQRDLAKEIKRARYMALLPFNEYA
ncbi:MAG TPA: 30S ribosomal protein S18 [candidate division CPR3 bacterium]|uniref:Small ribosomal subunit protein bS18 n=1 Tax=candidate division CPR3 bacterium TaxID=2268181 RepID=A0A7C1S9H5_UNCC3|nr:30S ribosomal protein S18 [candidate division CPR3 bacterium]